MQRREVRYGHAVPGRGVRVECEVYLNMHVLDDETQTAGSHRLLESRLMDMDMVVRKDSGT